MFIKQAAELFSQDERKELIDFLAAIRRSESRTLVLAVWEKCVSLPRPRPRARASAAARVLSTIGSDNCQCRDYARVDIRVDRLGQPFVLEINSMPGLGMTSPYPLSATTGGQLLELGQSHS
ncbi:hypothetical protein [Mesorhizobium sp. WSM2561]|uniref:hypothetical protein n=1 Tax=Mesorhizobium sp. WSM2561 TaxID=1040985 RepID=UPI001FD924D2|nr:hypothetical protein [Mesorhizobium sp. WSM2561]